MTDLIDLAAVAGLPVQLVHERLTFPPELGDRRPAIRTLEAMRPFLAVPGGRGQNELYFMYRDLGRPADRPALNRAGLRFDLTVLVAGDVAGELVKTAGHYHPVPAGGDLAYPELYAVIHGRANYLLQDGRGGGPSRAFLVEAEAGDIVIVPPNFGHVTINAGSVPLVMANWIEATFASVYEPFAEWHGGCYYEFAATGPGPRIEVNPAYGRLVPLTCLTASAFAAMGGPPCRRGEPVYRLGADHPEALRFLTHPEAWDWSSLVGRE
ncbi:MAG TPA: glucose-6-phosphate isomerase family protein [Bacillota bacterium]